MIRHLSIAACLMVGACAVDTPGSTDPTPAPPPIAVAPPDDLTRIGATTSCDGTDVIRGRQTLRQLEGGSVATLAPMQVNVDGSARAYHPRNAEAGAILHLCNAGRVHLPDGTRYHGSESNSVCTGKFMDDVARIRAAGWTGSTVGVVEWYGIAATGSTTIAGRTVRSVIPVLQNDGSGFYVSPTALSDPAFATSDQQRYVDPLAVAHAVVRRDSEVPLGTFGVAVRVEDCPTGRVCEPIPFIVADIGPRIGEGSVALTRAVNGLEVTDDITRANRFRGAVADPDILWVFFGGDRAAPPYSRASIEARAQAAFEGWGGEDRLLRCRREAIPLANAN